MKGNAAPAIDALVKLSETGNPSASSTSSIALGAIGTASDDPRILEALDRMLDEFLAIKRERAMEGIAMMGNRASSLAPKLKKLMDDRSSSVMPEAAQAYWSVSGDIESLRAPLAKYAESPTYETRVLKAIAQLGSNAKEFESLLLEKLSADELNSRNWAIHALAEIPKLSGRAKRKLAAVAESDPDVFVRYLAQRTLDAGK